MTEAEWRKQPGPWAHLTQEQTNELIAAAVGAERERCAAVLMQRHDELQENMSLGVRPMASMITGTLRDIVEELSPGYVEKHDAAKNSS